MAPRRLAVRRAASCSGCATSRRARAGACSTIARRAEGRLAPPAPRARAGRRLDDRRGLNGIAVHVANDRPHPLPRTLRVALYRDGEVCVGEAEADIQTGAHAVVERNVETLLGRFADVSHAYRFGAPQQDAIVASLEADGRLLSQSFRFPVGRPRETLSVDELGLQAVATAAPSGDVSLEIRSRRLTYGVRISAPGFVPDDDAFSLEPGRSRSIMLRPARGQASFGTVELRALNLSDSLRVPIR